MWPGNASVGWHEHDRRSFGGSFLHNCCNTFIACLNFFCCCWLLQDCLGGRVGPHGGGYGPYETLSPPPPLPRTAGPFGRISGVSHVSHQPGPPGPYGMPDRPGPPPPPIY